MFLTYSIPRNCMKNHYKLWVSVYTYVPLTVNGIQEADGSIPSSSTNHFND